MGDHYYCFHKISYHVSRGVVGEHDLPSQPVGEQHSEGRQYLKLERVWQGMTKEAFWGWNTVSDACGMFDLHQRDTV